MTQRTGSPVSAIGFKGRAVRAAAGIALALGAAVTGIGHGALADGGASHLRLEDVGWNSPGPHVLADGGTDDVGWNSGGTGKTDVGWNGVTPGSTDDVGWN